MQLLIYLFFQFLFIYKLKNIYFKLVFIYKKINLVLWFYPLLFPNPIQELVVDDVFCKFYVLSRVVWEHHTTIMPFPRLG